MRATTSEEDREVRLWVEASESNREQFIKTRKFYDLASMAYVMNPEAEPQANRSRTRLTRYARFYRYCAAVIIAVIAAGVWFFFRNADTVETNYPNLQALEIPAGQRLFIELADGTTVWLNSNTRLEFPGKFDKGERLVSIDGEAYFEVAKDSLHPFVVRTPHGNIEVKGTTFNVDAYSNSHAMIVNLIEGKVEIEKEGKRRTLDAGQRLVLEKSRAHLDDLHEEDLEWVDGIVSFYQLPLRDILQRFEKYYGVHVSYLSKEYPDSRFSGKFYIDEGIEQALKTLQRDMDFVYEIDKDRRNVIVK